MGTKFKVPLVVVKPFCMAAVLIGVFFIALGNWVVGLCMFLGSWQFEKQLYRCPKCNQKLNMKMPLFKSSRCPGCASILRD